MEFSSKPFLIFGTSVILQGCNPAQPPIGHNPNLSFLAGEPGGYPENSYFNAVWSIGGTTIYFLKDTEYDYDEFWSGGLWSITSSGSNEQKILEGNYSALTISHDGSKLTLVEYDSTMINGILILVDPVSTEKETLTTTSQEVQDVEFSSNDEKVFFYAEGNIYSIDTNGVGETLILDNLGSSYDQSPFDLSTDDSKIFFGGCVYYLADSTKKCYEHVGFSPQFHPLDPDLVLFSYYPYLQTLNLTSGEKNVLDAITSEKCKNGFPYWSPDGTKAVFSSSPLRIGFAPPDGPANLWILEIGR